MSKVVTIYGDSCDPREANEKVVVTLEDLLERARAGEIIGVVAVAVEFGEATTWSASAGQTDCNFVIGALFRLASDIAAKSRIA